MLSLKHFPDTKDESKTLSIIYMLVGLALLSKRGSLLSIQIYCEMMMRTGFPMGRSTTSREC